VQQVEDLTAQVAAIVHHWNAPLCTVCQQELPQHEVIDKPINTP